MSEMLGKKLIISVSSEDLVNQAMDRYLERGFSQNSHSEAKTVKDQALTFHSLPEFVGWPVTTDGCMSRSLSSDVVNRLVSYIHSVKLDSGMAERRNKRVSK